MIPQIKEIEGKFPKYATLSSATVSLNDMGDRTISAQVKIDGGQKPDFSYDWEVEFQGERYIHPLREPQASKGNESLCSTIDLVFQHKTIYELKRYYFVEMTSDESGTAIADKYIASLRLDLDKFCIAFQDVLDHYFKGENRIIIDLNPEWVSDKEPSFMEISYSHIWDVLLNIYEVYGVRWVIEGNTIKLGYDTEEVAHLFEYGFEGGLLKVERQVQSEELVNSLLGRGGDKNLPYRYFKDVDKENPSFKADPDWIPELAKISFGNLRGKTFRDYIKGWKAQRYGGEPMTEPTEEYLRGYADSERSTEEESFFDPIEYVEDKDSIDKYDLLQGSLDNVEDIFPTIQGVEVEGLGRVDEVVAVQKVEYDAADYVPEATHSWADTEVTKTYSIEGNVPNEFELVSEPFSISIGMIGSLYDYLSKAKVIVNGTAMYYDYVGGILYYKSQVSLNNSEVECKLNSIKFYDADSNEELSRLTDLTSDTKIYYKAVVGGIPIVSTNRFWNRTYTSIEYVEGFNPETGYYGVWPIETSHDTWYEMQSALELSVTVSTPLYQIQFGGEIIDNNVNNIPLSASDIIKPNEDKKIVLQASDLIVKEGPATMVDIPITTLAYKSGNIKESLKGQIEYKKNIILSDKATGEQVSIVNVPVGEYYCRVEVECHNNADVDAVFSITLLPTYLFPPAGKDRWMHTFDIWVKNIWGSTRLEGESDESYVERIWGPILGSSDGSEAKVCFSTGWLSSHSDYEFSILGVYFDDTQEFGGVKSEWKLTLEKSNAEVEATGMYIPNSQTNGQAYAGDKFFFIGIDMPHQYVLWAEERLDQYKREQLKDTAHIKPTWVVQTDKVRLNEERNGQRLIDSFKVGNTIRLADTRFIEGEERLYLQSVTYTWDAQTVMLPNVEVVLSDKVATSSNPVSLLQGEVDALTKQVGSISNIQQIVRAVGDRLYLRKDGFADNSNSETTFNKQINSRDYRQGAVAGQGWALRAEQGKGIIECDKLVVRDEMQVNSLVANQVSAIGGKEILSAASIECIKVDVLEKGFKCYFDQKRGSVTNHFVVGDIAYSQVFDPHNIQVKYYRRVVTEVGDNYIMLSTQSTGDGTPQEGDVIVQYGNMDTENHPERQFVIIRDIIGGGYEQMLCDLNDIDADGTEYFFAGRLEGGTPRWFVGHPDGEHAEWKDGKLRIKGVLEVGSDVGGATVVEGGLVTAETIALGTEGTINAGITGEGEGDNAIRFWAGATEDNKENAPFKVRDDGTVEVKGKGIFDDLVIKGSTRSPFGSTMRGATIETYDNYYNFGVISSELAVPCGMEQSGRRLTLVGTMSLYLDTIDTTVSFFEKGTRPTTLSLKNEIVELLGYTNEGIFRGWIVLNRTTF